MVFNTGKTYFIRQNLKLYLDQDLNQNRDQNQNQNQNQNQHQANNIVIVCKDDRDWIDPESNKFYTGFNKCDMNMNTTINMQNFKIV